MTGQSSVPLEPVSLDPVPWEAVQAGLVESESVGSKSVGSESVGSESVGSESVETESVESESVGSESVGAQAAQTSRHAADAADVVAGLLRSELIGRHPYGAPQLAVTHRLNVNENPYPPSAGLVADIAAAVAAIGPQLNRYPDRDAIELRADLAAYIASDCPGVTGLGVANVWAANGSNEVILQLLQAFAGAGRRVLTFAPTYSMYPDYCTDTASEFHTAPRRDDFTIDVDSAKAAIAEVDPDVILLASPNNPTGTALPSGVIAALHDAARGLLVVDEAYAEFRRRGTPSAVELLAGRPRLVVTRTMSKAFALAGVRLGYLVADPAVVDAVQLVRLPYHLSAVTQAVARVALAHRDELLGTVAALRQQRDELLTWLRSRGLKVADSDANFVMFGQFPDARTVFEALLERGVLVRVVGPPGWLRVSAGTPTEMAAFRAALCEVLGCEVSGCEVLGR